MSIKQLFGHLTFTGLSLNFLSDSLMGNMKNKMVALTNLTHLLSHVFSSHFVFPVLGHDDPEPLPDAEEPYKDLAELWKQWLPSEALVTFRKGKLRMTPSEAYPKDL